MMAHHFLKRSFVELIYKSAMNTEGFFFGGENQREDKQGQGFQLHRLGSDAKPDILFSCV